MADNNDVVKAGAAKLDDDMLEYVAGGVYSYEEWMAMTPEERMDAWRVSKAKRAEHEYCQLD